MLDELKSTVLYTIVIIVFLCKFLLPLRELKNEEMLIIIAYKSYSFTSNPS